MRFAGFAFLLALATGCVTALDVEAVVVPDGAVTGVVERVVDGDTVIIEVGGARERVRLLRIDTPEVSRDEARPSDCLADEATAALERLLPAGATVSLWTDVELRDRYDRLLAHVWADGRWINGQMLADGYAQVITFPPNVAYGDEALAAELDARGAGRGLWDPTAC